MRILVVSFVFPPYNIIGSVRVGKMAKYLWRFGHDVRVLAAHDSLPDRTLGLELPAERVTYSPWTNVDAPYERLLVTAQAARARLRRHAGGPGRSLGPVAGPPATGTTDSAHGRESAFRDRRTVMWHVRAWYKDLLHVPDGAIGWLRPGTAAAAAITRDWQPDVVLASGAPWTAFLIARRVAERTGAPWVGDLRDLWYGNPYVQYSPWRHRTVDAWLERRVLRTAAGLVTVSEPLAAELRARYPGTPVQVVLNGFDHEDFEPAGAPAAGAGTVATGTGSDAVVRILYTGNLFPGRDILPLIVALRRLGDDARAVRVEIVGNRNEGLRTHYEALAAQHGVADRIAWLPPVPHAEAVRLQQAADALLLVMNHEPSEAGIYTGKIFEYVGARRPILLIGLATGVAAELVRGRALGAVTTTADEIAAVLRQWIAAKRSTGALSSPSSVGADDLTRQSQTRVIERLLQQVARGAATANAPHGATSTADAAAG